MCAISGSFQVYKLEQLYKLNAYRGELSYSFNAFKVNNNRVELAVAYSDDGSLPEHILLASSWSNQPNNYYIAHSQAPTTQTDDRHPAMFGDAMLWHNGIIKQSTIPEETWDTAWLLEKIIDYGWSSLSRVDGTFACVMYYGGELFVFRNEISPLFIDDNLNISSTKFEGSKSLEPNKVFKMYLTDKKIAPVAYFETVENPYYFGDAA